jgi:Chloramphenicol O-acetyltransferase
MKYKIDIKHWKRQSHFQFFSNFEDPLFGMVANVDCSLAYRYTKEHHLPFYLYYLYQSLSAVNAIENFRYRIEEGQPVLYDTIHASTTILKADETFGFVFLPYYANFSDFLDEAQHRIDAAKQVAGLGLDKENARHDVIHYSAIPWVSFSSITHERSFQTSAGIPKITFGKYFWQDKKLIMPVSVFGHHGLMDGFHIGQYFEHFEALLTTVSV